MMTRLSCSAALALAIVAALVTAAGSVAAAHAAWPDPRDTPPWSAWTTR